MAEQVNAGENQDNKIKLPKSLSRGQIIDSYQNIHELLDKMNHTIDRIFRCKEDELKGTIKEQIQEAQQQLQQLTQLTTEEEVERKMKLKKQEIEEQRQQILQSSMEFQKLCIEYKTSLAKVMTQTKDYHSEISFLDDQILHAKQNKDKLKSQLEKLQQSILPQSYYPLESSDQQPEFSEIGGESIEEQYEIAVNELNKAKRMSSQFSDIRHDQAYDENQVEQIFLECVNKVKQHKQHNDVQKLMMASKNKRTFLKPIQSLKQFQKLSEQVNKQDMFFSDWELTDIHKRMIFDEFLSRSEIKALIYNLL